MKKTYMTPVLQVVKIQPAQFIANSLPQLGGTTQETYGNAARSAHFSDWEEE